MKNYDYIKSEKKVEGVYNRQAARTLRLIGLSDISDKDQASNPLKGINVDAAGGAGKVLRMVAEKVLHLFFPVSVCQADILALVVKAGCATANRKARHTARGGKAKGRRSSGAEEGQQYL